MRLRHSQTALLMTVAAGMWIAGSCIANGPSELEAVRPGPEPTRTADGEPEAVQFGKHIAPLLQKKCVACHRSKQAEGGLSLETPDEIRKGGDSGMLWSGDDPESSLLFARVTGSEEPLMPPEDNSVGAEPLTDEEKTLLRGWIRAGARFDEKELGQDSVWQPIPDEVRGSYSLAVGPLGQMAAVARANRVELLEAGTGVPSAKLVDPQLPQKGVADVDVIGAMSFSPMGDRIATGGYRTLRIWKKVPVRPTDHAVWERVQGLCTVSPSQNRVALVDALGDVQLWEKDGTEPIGRFVCPDVVTDLGFAGPDHVVVGTAAGNVSVIEFSTARPVRTRRLPKSIAAVSSMSPDSVAVLQSDGVVQWLGPTENAPTLPEDQMTGIGVCLVISGDRLILGSESGQIRMLDLRSGKMLQTFEQGAAVTAMAFSENDDSLCVGDGNGQIKIWNCQDGAMRHAMGADAENRLRETLLNRDVAREQAWLSALEGEAEGKKKLLEAEDAALAKVKEGYQKAETELAEKQKQRDTTTQEIGDTEKAIADAKVQEQDAAKRAEAATLRRAEITQQIAALKQSVEVAQKEAEKTLATQKEAERVARVAAEEAAQAAEKTKSTAEVAAKKSMEMKDTLNKATTALAEVELQLKDAMKRSDDAKARREASEKALKGKQEALEKQKKESEDKRRELNDRQQALVTSQKTRDRAARQIPEHEDQLRTRRNRLSRIEKQLKQANNKNLVRAAVSAIGFSPDGKRVVSADRSGGVKLFDARSGKSIGKRNLSAQKRLPVSWKLSFYSPHEWVASADHGQAVLHSTKNDWQLEHTLGGPASDLFQDRVTAIDFQPGGRVIAVGSGAPSRDGQVVLVSAADGRVLKSFDGLHSDSVLCLKFSPDGRTLASGSADKSIRLVDVGTGRVVGALDGHTHHVLSVAWRRDGRQIASGSADATIKTWDPVSGQRQRTITGFPDEVTAVEYVEDLPVVASVCSDGQLRVHEANSGKFLRGASASGDFLFDLGISADGKTIFASGHLGDVHRWKVEDATALPVWK